MDNGGQKLKESWTFQFDMEQVYFCQYIPSKMRENAPWSLEAFYPFFFLSIEMSTIFKHCLLTTFEVIYNLSNIPQPNCFPVSWGLKTLWFSLSIMRLLGNTSWEDLLLCMYLLEMGYSSLWMLTDLASVWTKQTFAGEMHFANPKEPFAKGLGSKER